MAGAIGGAIISAVPVQEEFECCCWLLCGVVVLLVVVETTGENWRQTIVPRKSSESSESLYCKTKRSLLLLLPPDAPIATAAAAATALLLSITFTIGGGGSGGDCWPCSIGGVTSKSMLPFNGILILPLGPVRLPPRKESEWSIAMRLTSSTLDVLRWMRPCRRELDRRKRISSTLSECDRPRLAPRTDGDVGTPNDMSGLSGNEREFAFCGGPNLEPGVALLLRLLSNSQMLMCERRRLLCRSNVLWAENGLGLIKYLKFNCNGNRARYF